MLIISQDPTDAPEPGIAPTPFDEEERTAIGAAPIASDEDDADASDLGQTFDGWFQDDVAMFPGAPAPPEPVPAPAPSPPAEAAPAPAAPAGAEQTPPEPPDESPPPTPEGGAPVAAAPPRREKRRGVGCAAVAIGLLLVGGLGIGTLALAGVAVGGAVWYAGVGQGDGAAVERPSAPVDDEVDAALGLDRPGDPAADVPGRAPIHDVVGDETTDDVVAAAPDADANAADEVGVDAGGASSPPPPSARPRPRPDTNRAAGTGSSPSPSGADAVVDPSPSRPEAAAPAPQRRPIEILDAPPSSHGRVGVRGSGEVVLVKGGRRFALPADVPSGKYTIRVTFDGEPEIEVGNLRVKAGDQVVVACNAGMGICRAR